MLLFWGFMSEAQKSWKSLMEKTYEIIPSTHRIVPCKIFSIALSKAVKIRSSEEDPNVSPEGLLHLAACWGDSFIPNLQSKVNFTQFKPARPSSNPQDSSCFSCCSYPAWHKNEVTPHELSAGCSAICNGMSLQSDLK